MLGWLRSFGRALRNVARLARADPVWALTAVIFSPLALVRHLAKNAVLFLIVFVVLVLGGQALLRHFGFAQSSAVYQLVMMLAVLAVVLVTGRALFLPFLLKYGGPDGDATHGSARFATAREAQPLTRADGLLIGRSAKAGKALRYAGPAHLLTIAPTRTGKGVGTIIPNLLTYPGSVLCIDPKGENARVAARQRGKFGAVHVLDPFDVSGRPASRYNPLDRLDPHGLDLAEDANTLADALVHDSPGQAGEAH